MKIADIPQLREAPLTAKLELLDDLWADITAKASQLPLPDWHIRELDRSLADYEANPKEGRPWPEIRDDLLGKR